MEQNVLKKCLYEIGNKIYESSLLYNLSYIWNQEEYCIKSMIDRILELEKENKDLKNHNHNHKSVQYVIKCSDVKNCVVIKNKLRYDYGRIN